MKVLAGIAVAAVVAGCCLIPLVVMGVVSRLGTHNKRKVGIGDKVTFNPKPLNHNGERDKEHT